MFSMSRKKKICMVEPKANSVRHFVLCFVVTLWLGNVTGVVVVGVYLN